MLAFLLATGQVAGQQGGSVDSQAALGAGFTYQGELRDAGGPVNGTCDLRFSLWDAASSGAQVGATVAWPATAVTDGLFSVQLDFGGGAFAGQARWLEVAVRCPAGSGSYTVLSPRQPLTATPYALYAARTPWAGLSGVPGGFADGSDADALGALSCGSGQVAKWNGAAWACAADQTGAGSYWSLTGNAGTVPGTNYLGTSDNAALEIKVNGARALRLEPGSSPNLLGGYSGNLLTAGVVGATIGGGGSSGWAQRVTDNYGTVGGGVNNRAGDDTGTVSDASYATVGGGLGNTAQRESATIGGGSYNNVLGAYGTVAGGDHNHAYGQNSTVAGGGWNEVTGGGSYASIGGGYENSATQPHTTVAGGTYNSASGQYATVSGGRENTASVQYATVGGGYDNSASNEYTTVGGGSTNTASQLDATVTGGSHNTASGARAAVGGGYGNTASGQSATVGGGQWNTAAAAFATIGGGGPSDLNNSQTTNNRVTDTYGTVGGGADNRAGSDDGNPNNQAYATVGGGASNYAFGQYATVGGGFDNRASGVYATVGGGHDNAANGMNATVGGGEANYASGDLSIVSGGLNNWATGHGAMVPGGYHNRAVGSYSLTAGYNAVAYNEGCFVWGDHTSGEVSCNVDNRWVARASGGVNFYTNSALSSGVYISPGGNSWNGISDRAVKENFIPVDAQALLETLASLPVQDYNLKSQDPAIRHIGLVAQDFATLGYGESDLAINMQDADGVALAAIQGLYQQIQALEAENDELEARLAALEAGRSADGAPVRLPSGWLLVGGGVLAVGAAVGRRAWGGGR